ncbi:MAG: cell division protein FtsL [Gemmobacter sp.]|nr:cell division protein FtsL [Gemmobacter sp.]
MMRTLLLVASGLVVMTLGFWAYRENYHTQEVLKDARRLSRDITVLREAIAVQRAEWAYLNRPDRLTELVAANFDRLGLMAMVPEQFADIRNLPEPLPPEPLIDGAVDVMALDPSFDPELLP